MIVRGLRLLPGSRPGSSYVSMADAKTARAGSVFPSGAAMSAAPGREPHLLVVDDDERLRTLLQRYLSANGFRISAARDAGEARALMKGMAFDALVLDVMMPGESGFDLAKSVRAQSAVPILMLTARGEALPGRGQPAGRSAFAGGR